MDENTKLWLAQMDRSEKQLERGEAWLNRLTASMDRSDAQKYRFDQIMDRLEAFLDDASVSHG